MKEEYKKILKVWLVLYVVFTVFKIINTFNQSILDNIFSIGTYPLAITSLILFVFVANRGEEKIGKYGIISIIIFFVFHVLYKLDVYNYGFLSSTSFFDKICSTIYIASSYCIDILEYMAIFSFIKGNEKVENYKFVALIGIVGYSILSLISNIFLVKKLGFLINIRSCLSDIGMLAKYAVIILYLTDEGYIPRLFVDNGFMQEVPSQNYVNNENSLGQTASVYSENINQPMVQTQPQSMVNVNQVVEQQSIQNVNNITQPIAQNPQVVEQNTVTNNQMGPLQ